MFILTSSYRRSSKVGIKVLLVWLLVASESECFQSIVGVFRANYSRLVIPAPLAYGKKGTDGSTLISRL
jgi:hypothetical protein